jgi:Mrp family chromosome partitioning ATPase
MGKVFDALEKHKKGASVEPKAPLTGCPSESINGLSDSPFSSQSLQQTDFSGKVVTISSPSSVEAETFKLLRARLLFPKEGESPRTIMVTSTFPGEGKTFVAVNLAASIATGVNQHVLLVDCDFRRPNAHSMFGYSNVNGLY